MAKKFDDEYTPAYCELAKQLFGTNTTCSKSCPCYFVPCPKLILEEATEDSINLIDKNNSEALDRAIVAMEKVLKLKTKRLGARKK